MFTPVMLHYSPSPEKYKQLKQAKLLQQQQQQQQQSNGQSSAVQIPNSANNNTSSNSNQNSYSNYNHLYKQQQLQLQLQQHQNQKNNNLHNNNNNNSNNNNNINNSTINSNINHNNSSNLTHNNSEDHMNSHTLLHKPIRSKPARYKVSYSVGDVRGDKHCFGINSLVFDNESSQLYSAGRDSTVKLWSVDHQTNSVQHKHCFEGHNDWVNDIFINPKQSILVSGSSDSSIKVWNTNSGECLRTERRHEDYVKALAYAPNANYFASSGLDSHIVLWDLNVFTPTGTLSNGNGVTSSTTTTASTSLNNGLSNNYVPQFNIARAGGDNISIYSLAINNEASLVLAGSTERTIRAWDVVGGKKIFKLKGHTDNVRSIIISSDSRRCLSASSDGSFRLWDIGMQRCIHSFDDIHTDSVWSLAVSPTFSHVYSGGRDGLIYSTDLKTFQSTLVCKEANPVLKIVHDEQRQSIWVSTTDSEIKNWSLNGATKEKIEPRFIDEDKDEESVNNISAILNANEPIMKIAGRPGMIKHHIMNNRRHVLTKDTSDNVQLWDITKGELIGDYGKVDFDKQVNELQEIISIPKWLSVDTKTGNINITMEPPHCFSADAHLSNLGVTLQEGEPDELYNTGERVLASLFSHFVKEKHNRQNNVNSNQYDGDTVDSVEDEPQQQAVPSSTNNNNNNDSNRQKVAMSGAPPSSTNKAPPKRMIFELPKDTSIVIFDDNNVNNSFRIRLSEFTGLESVDVIPTWVYDCLFGGPTQKKETKDIYFMMSPSDEKNISPIAKGIIKFNQAPHTQIRKLIGHISWKLKLLEPNSLVEEYIEMLCDNKVLLPTYTLSTVRAFFWKSGDDIQLTYRVKPAYGNENELRKLVKLNQIKKITVTTPTITGSTPSSAPANGANKCNSNGNSNSKSNSNSANSSPSLIGQHTIDQDYVINGKNNKSSPMISTISNGANELPKEGAMPPSLSISSSPKPSISTNES
ncbi:WD40 repeat-containing protein [Heterostelium album PN500]|uniref:WD40 repeat-containing protein n=1 Tax=Heterostelium pallidum (strain ATCC 26659 / Pp 5 / PN500) TaxID=670386 RepID=D3BJU0_HETP5|nr:WD40 repeat-containing protein [Heterostelium album PN500]EFA78170.1 WD40 repeat-containing protein [Heterostelium album PN500]|eukprot:XP_020430296.1 WD40 repeat-containing protein [Heterostelium album PN500]